MGELLGATRSVLRLHLGLGVAVDRPRQLLQRPLHLYMGMWGVRSGVTRQLLQRSLHRRAQRLLDAAVDVLDEVGPLALHLQEGEGGREGREREGERRARWREEVG